MITTLLMILIVIIQGFFYVQSPWLLLAFAITYILLFTIEMTEENRRHAETNALRREMRQLKARLDKDNVVVCPRCGKKHEIEEHRRSIMCDCGDIYSREYDTWYNENLFRI